MISQNTLKAYGNFMSCFLKDMKQVDPNSIEKMDILIAASSATTELLQHINNVNKISKELKCQNFLKVLG